MPQIRARLRRLSALLVSATLACSAVACKTAPQPTDEGAQQVAETPAEPQSITLRFGLTDAIEADLEVPPAGELRGALFHTSDVGGFGPKKGAEPVAKLDPRQVDFASGDVLTWTTPTLPPGEYTFLGFVDLDGNSPDGPDDGDLVTRPATNRFELPSAEDTLDIRFDYIKGSTIFG
ncbi:MAG: hypothetical protein ACQEVA_21250 [Myxococcota bacterium]